MLNCGQLLKSAQNQNPHKDQARMAIFNWLSAMYDPTEPLTVDVLDSFFRQAAEYPHWQQNKQALTKEVSQLIEFTIRETGETVDLEGLKWPHEMQVIEIDSTKDHQEVCQLWLQSQTTSLDKYKLIPDGKKWIGVVLKQDSTLEIHPLDRKCVVRFGQLEPLKKEFVLKYTRNLDLIERNFYNIDLGSYVQSRFMVDNNQVVGSIVRGYMFQKFHDFRGQALVAYPRLYYALKRIEQFFVDRKSDPFYQGLLSKLEKLNLDLKISNKPEIYQEATEQLALAQNALEYVFTGDKLLSLLIRDLQNLVSQSPSSSGSFGSTSLSIKQKTLIPQMLEEDFSSDAVSSIKGQMSWNQEQKPSEKPNPNRKIRTPGSDLTN